MASPFHWLDVFGRRENIYNDDEALNVFERFPPGANEQPTPHTFIYGDLETCAVYLPGRREAAESHGNFPSGSVVYLEVTSRPLIESCWWKEFQSEKPRILRAIFSCVSHLETGAKDVDPNDIGDQTFAVCHGTSIFVPESLLKDPLESSSEIPVERMAGNVGKPGLSFLISSPGPKIRKVNHSTWHMISHEPFDGVAQDSFRETTFHLSFTGYEHAIHLGNCGGRDVPASFLETAVSVYDRREWVHDLDILGSSTQWIKLPDPQREHSDEQKTNQIFIRRLVSVDPWMELLDPPLKASMVRAHGNLVARLPVAGLAVRQSDRVFILNSSPCWECQLKAISRYGPKRPKSRIPLSP
ncbi:uncharacterized protein F4822DRAFT_440853 [Hypoxylon trugodes]|uniref:uncharacterized protein n=1 Tax=Hypoxylon trugodes TaxID=326681 RepID=UPI00219CD979|nr:uncharacterized protein F4822DRAFT_440853 [Hypoxylon trugodes]KAI1382824.1 hypothetical protein F4822DRAFT_440853 [Hypoxylon trugodes]